MSTIAISIAGFAINVTIESEGPNGITGVLDLTRFEIGGVELLRISSATDPTQGAQISMSAGSNWGATITGEIALLNGAWSQSKTFAVAHDSFYVELPSLDLGSNVGLGGSFAFADGQFTVDLTGSAEVGFSFFGVTVSPTFELTLGTTIVPGAPPSVVYALSGGAGVLGVSVPLPPPPLASPITFESPITSAAAIGAKIYAIAKDFIEDVIWDYLQRWAQELERAVIAGAEFVANYGAQIVDAVGDGLSDLFGSSDDGPPPPILPNAFADGTTPLGDVALQWGQASIAVDEAKDFDFVRPFGGAAVAVALCAARSGVRSGLSVKSRASTKFVLDRDNAIDGLIPFHWLALGAAPGRTLPTKGSRTIGDVLIQWGRETSESDGVQVFSLSSAFNTASRAGPIVMITNADTGGVKGAFNVTTIDGAGKTFAINRDNAIDGAFPITYLAIGPAPGKKVPQGVLAVDDFLLQWGIATTDADGEQRFLFPRAFKTMNFAVVTTFHAANALSALSQSRPIDPAGFILDRDNAIDGAYSFFWVAAGR
ncbi:MAG: hypothetical protein R3B09_17905 [Nannocystaceae bacterium]